MKLNQEAEVMLTVNFDAQDKLMIRQIGVVKHLEIIENKVSLIYKKYDDLDANKNWLRRILPESIIEFQLKYKELHLSSEIQIHR